MASTCSEPFPEPRRTGTQRAGRAGEERALPPGEGAALRFRGVSRRIGRRSILDGVSLAVGTGEALALVGVNGAGKSTCIKALLDLCETDSGTIEIFGIPHTEHRARSRVAYLPERFLPPWYLNGRDFLRYMVRLQGAGWRELRAREVCEQLELDPSALARPARHCSKGMSQKLGLAAALLCGRDLLVLDEPMSGLDPRARGLACRLLDRHRAGGGAIVFSTHAIEDLPGLCDRVILLHAGAVAFAGDASGCVRRFGGHTLAEACARWFEDEALPLPSEATRRVPGARRAWVR